MSEKIVAREWTEARAKRRVSAILHNQAAYVRLSGHSSGHARLHYKAVPPRHFWNRWKITEY